MSWEEQLFAVLDELEQEASAAFDRERSAEIADRGRAEYRAVTLASRLMASVDEDVVLDVAGVGHVVGQVRRVGDGWCLVAASGCDWVVSHAAIDVVREASPRSRPESAWCVADRLGLGSVLRRIAEAAEPCVLHLRSGTRHEGLVARVGADFVEVTFGLRDAHRAAMATQLVSFAALAGIQSAPHLAG